MARVILLDGGMGQELLARTGDPPTPLWATAVMRDHPGLVRAVHADYFAAGATVATMNSYALHRDRLERFGDPAAFEALHAQARAEAMAARAAHGAGAVALSLGPLVASYRADVLPPHAEAVARSAEIVALHPGVDLILAETVASLAHAEAVLEATAGAPVPVWLSVTVDDEDGTRLRSGEAVAELAPLADRFGPAALLANCSAPEAVEQALGVLAGLGRPFGGYANGFARITKEFLKDGATVDALPARDLSPQAYAATVLRWVEAGATIVGGCCNTRPAHIAAIAGALAARGHEIVAP